MPEDEVKPGAPEWVVTFGDMMSLLLTFFVLLLSFANMEAQQFKVVAGYLREAFGLQREFSYTGVPMGTTIMSTDARTHQDSSDELKLIQMVRRQLEQARVTEQASVEKTERGVAVRLDGELVFDSGQSELRPGARAILTGIAEIAAERSGIVEVQGHTDDVPVSTPRFPSNWELSGARAGSAARFLMQQGVPAQRIKAVGYAATRPIVPNDTTENRAKNRRVEFLFVKEPAEPARAEPISMPDPIPTPAG